MIDLRHLTSGKSEVVLNTGFRVATMGLRFCAIIIIALWLAPRDVTHFSIVVAVSSYGVLAVGLELHSFNLRSIVAKPRSSWLEFMRSQVFASSIVFITLFCPITLLVMLESDLPGWLLASTVIITALDYISTEIERFLVLAESQLAASSLLFVRQGIWPIVVFLVFSVIPNLRTLSTCIFLWVFSSILSVFIGVFLIKRVGIGGWHSDLDFNRLKTALITSFVFLLMTLFLRFILIADRLWANYQFSSGSAASYVLAATLANALVTICNAAIHSFAFPKMVGYAAMGKIDELSLLSKKTLIRSISLGLVTTVCGIVVCIVLRNELTDRVYEELPVLFGVSALAMTFFVASIGSHYVLYSLGSDKVSLSGSVIAFLCFCIVIYPLSHYCDQLGVSIAVLSSFLLLFIFRYIAENRLLKSEFENHKSGESS